MLSQFHTPIPTTLDEALALLQRDLPDWRLELSQCRCGRPECNTWCAELTQDVPLPSNLHVVVVDEEGEPHTMTHKPGWCSGAYGDSPLDAILAAYPAALERVDDPEGKLPPVAEKRNDR